MPPPDVDLSSQSAENPKSIVTQPVQATSPTTASQSAEKTNILTQPVQVTSPTITSRSELPESRKAVILKDKNKVLYNKDSSAPFIVALNKANIGNKHVALVGALLFKSKIDGIKRISKINKDLINVEFEKFEQANKLAQNFRNLLPYKDTKCFIPLKFITRRFIINNVPSELNIETIGSFLKEKNKNVISVRRIFKKAEDNNLIPTARLDVLAEGTKIPEYMYLFYTRCSCSPYIYNVTKCTNCLNYGHRADYNGNLTCKSKSRCHKCSEIHAAHDLCPNEIKCFHCLGSHITFDNTCPELAKQKVIKKLMAVNNLSFKEAKELAESKNQETLKIKLNERIQAIQQKTLAGEQINVEDLKISDFPQLVNRYAYLSESDPMEIDETSSSSKRNSYADVSSSPSPTRKKAKLLDDSYDPEMPSDEWLQNYVESLPKDLAVKPSIKMIKGFWPKVIERVKSSQNPETVNTSPPALDPPPLKPQKQTSENSKTSVTPSQQHNIPNIQHPYLTRNKTNPDVKNVSSQKQTITPPTKPAPSATQ